MRLLTISSFLLVSDILFERSNGQFSFSNPFQHIFRAPQRIIRRPSTSQFYSIPDLRNSAQTYEYQTLDPVPQSHFSFSPYAAQHQPIRNANHGPHPPKRPIITPDLTYAAATPVVSHPHKGKGYLHPHDKGWGWHQPYGFHGWGWPHDPSPFSHGHHGPHYYHHDYHHDHHHPTKYGSPKENNSPDVTPNETGAPVDKPVESNPEDGGPTNDPYNPKAETNQACTRFDGSPPVIQSAEDLQSSGWNILSTDNKTLSPMDVFNTPVRAIPLTPTFIRIGNNRVLPPGFSTRFMKKIELDFSEQGRSAGFSVTKESFYVGDSLDTKKISSSSSRSAARNSNTITVTTMVHLSPNVSAPLRGNGNTNSTSFFQRGLNLKQMNAGRGISKPYFDNIFEAQLDTLGQLFNDIQSIERRFKSRSRTRNEDDFQSVVPPMFVTQVQGMTIPEPDSSERTILDSVFNFGQAAYRQEFGDLQFIPDSWEGMKSEQTNKRNRMNLNQFSGMEDATDTMYQWVRNYVKYIRDLNRNSFNHAEIIASESFRTFQYNLAPPGGDAGSSEYCPVLFDPTNQGTTGAEGFGQGSGIFPGGTRNLPNPRLISR